MTQSYVQNAARVDAIVALPTGRDAILAFVDNAAGNFRRGQPSNLAFGSILTRALILTSGTSEVVFTRRSVT